MRSKNNNMKWMNKIAIALFLGLAFSSCRHNEASNITSWDYNNPKQGGFQRVPFVDQETGPGLVLIEGGTFTMGRTEQDVMHDWNNRSTRVTVSSFYMDQTEVSNFHWLEYLYWISRAYGENFPQVYKNALPDTLVWRTPLAYNEKYVEYYLRHPAYRDYPVVGVSWLQANDFCKWRTDRVNEYILIREGVFGFNIDQRDEATFNTEAYYAGQYGGEEGNEPGTDGLIENVQDLNPSAAQKNKKGKLRLGTRRIKMEDGILLPRYRLPTEAEWEFAALGLIGNLSEGSENITERRFYPWNGHWVRQDGAEWRGEIRANFVRGRGDYMGVAGRLNDGADVTAPVESYWPNDVGLYNMAGNVSEWVLDTYRPLSSEDFDEFRPFRGNVFTTKLLGLEGKIDNKNIEVIYDVHGMKEYLHEFERVRYQRISADKHDPLDTAIRQGLSKNIEARNPNRRGYAPDPIYVANGNVKDSVELYLIARINKVLDSAIVLKNLRYDEESSQLVKDSIFDSSSGILAITRESPDGIEYAHEIISMLRVGFGDFITDTPGKIKYRKVTEEENIGRTNYRKSDYADYLDGDIETSIFYKNDERKNAINQAQRDQNLVMYQSQHENFDLQGGQLRPDFTGWPTTLVSDKSKVYKGGSWRDRAYWLSAGNRRFMDEDKASCTVGFRCAMDRVGSPTGMNYGRKKKDKSKNKK